MKHPIGTLVVFFVLLFAYTKLVGPIPFSVTSVTTQKTDFFSVEGEGKATAAPDLALVTAGVQTQGTSVHEVQQEINKKINAVSDAVKKVGIADSDIQTGNYTISPMYDYRQGQKITGYQGSTTLTIKIHAIEKANGVMDAATQNGANVVGSVSFEVSDKTKAENEAREKAVAQAQKKATDAARIAGFKLGRVVNYQESFGGIPRPLPLSARAQGVGEAPTQIEPGTNEITVHVTLSYEIL